MLRWLALLSFFLLTKIALAQDPAAWKKKGDKLLAAQQYLPALEAFQVAERNSSPDAETLTNIGICHYHLHQPEQAEAQLFAALNTKKEPPPINFIYLAKLHQARLEFEKAADFYKQFLKNTPADHPWRPAVKDEIRRCATGLHLRRLPPFAAVLPLADLNTAADEYHPLPSPSGQERLYFSATGRSENGSDIFYSEVKTGDWSAPRPLNRFINGAGHETALGFDDSGTNLYFFRGETPDFGQILVDTFREDLFQGTLFFEAFSGPMRPGEGDCAPFFFNDSILLFASRRLGGFGGLDLYVSTRHADTWTPAENLGPVVNSAHNDTSPFLSRDGRTLFFSSSDATRSMGGLDILQATWLDRSARWSPPINLGPPINSASDDEHFTLSHGGDRGFFDSDRITGEGGRDLFVAIFDEQREWQLSESWPVAFCLVAEGEKSPAPSERDVQPPGSFFDEITSFELPVMTLPPPGGTPNEQAVNQFALLAQLLKKFPRLRATLALHSAVGDVPVGYAVFASQTVTDLLRQEGVGRERVALIFAGSSFPLAGKPSTGVNRRAEVFIENPTELPFELYRPALPPGAQKAGFFQKAMASLAYYVTVDGELAKLFELYPDGLAGWLSQSGGMFFTPGIYLTHASAEEWLQSLQADGFKSAKITAHLRGRELSKEEAAKYVGDFPDLVNFIGN